jgi:hypothetical protein
MNRLKALLARITPRQILIVTYVTVITLGLTVVLRNAVRELVVVPLSTLAWVAGLLINSVPQSVWLGVLVLVSAIIAIRILASGTGAKSPYAAFVESPTVTPTRLAFWMGRLSNVKSSPYMARRTLNELRMLAVSSLAHEFRMSKEDVIDQMRQGELDVNPDVRAILLEHHDARPEPSNPLRDFIARVSGWFSQVISRVTGRAVAQDATMPRDFQHKVNTLLSYVESMNK